MSHAPSLRGRQAPGLEAAARFMRAAGPSATPIWAELTETEALAISAHMKRLSTDAPQQDHKALEAFLRESANRTAQTPAPEGLWGQLNQTHAAMLAAIANRESAQVSAWIISRLDPGLAATVVRMLDDARSQDILQRILDIRPPAADVTALIEDNLRETLKRLGGGNGMDGHAKVARIVDQLATGEDDTVLAKLEAKRPGSAERVQAFRFTFENLVSLDSAGMQTLLTRIDRHELALAMKGASTEVTNQIFSNLTQRAGAMIREEMNVLGSVPRREVDVARTRILETARQLIARGDIRATSGPDADELVE